MANPSFLTGRNFFLLSIASLGGTYMILRSRTLTEKQREKGDYSVTVDRSVNAAIGFMYLASKTLIGVPDTPDGF
ncbi:hypothetical protein CC78DRAFT_575821 [Lojkania enalia]|uniref:Uncharacterized protein n=1 Tax=Lojkania enalia TaxID=147567 RepID=A0A9P4KIB3_9PLEO|nr:hypothetical protein CC78DRAFT_575821 [Didymosphaeria enalia]